MKPFAHILLSTLLLAAMPVRSALADDAIRIASIYSLTGPAVGANEPSVKGVRLGITEINKHGGILGKKLELLEFDNHSTPIGSKVAAEQAVQAGVTAILGAAWSSHSLVIARVAQSSKIPMITNVSTNPEVTRIGDHIFRVCFNDHFQGRVMGTFARQELNARTAVLLVDVTSDYGMELAREFQRHFETLGGRVVGSFPYKHGQEDFKPLIGPILEKHPDVLFLPGYLESAVIITEAEKLGLKAIPLGGDGWDAPGFFHLGGSGIRLAYYCTHWSKHVDNEASRQFLALHRPEEEIRSPEALAYDAVLVLADAVRRAGSVEPGRVREALAATSGFPGVTGTISFDVHGDPVKPAVIMAIEEGRERLHKSVVSE